MPSKGKEPHRFLKEKAIEMITQKFDIDEIENINIEPRKENQRSRWRDVMSVNTACFGLKSERIFFPDIVFFYPVVILPKEKEEISETDDGLKQGEVDSDLKGDRPKQVIVIECEVRANSQLLSGGLRYIGYKMLKEEHKDRIHLILVKYKGVEMKNTDIFDDIWEFDKE